MLNYLFLSPTTCTIADFHWLLWDCMIRLSSSQITSETAGRFSWYLVTRGHLQTYPYNEGSAFLETHYQTTWVHIAEYSNLHNQTWEPQNSKDILWTKLHWKCSNYKIFIIFQKYITALHYQSLFNDDSLQAGQSWD